MDLTDLISKTEPHTGFGLRAVFYVYDKIY